MEFALKEVIEAENNRISELREILIGKDKTALENNKGQLQLGIKLKPARSIGNGLAEPDVGFVHGPPGTGKTTTLVQAITKYCGHEKQVLVCAPSNAAVDFLAEKLSEQGLRVLRIGHPARVTEQSLSKTLDAKIAAHPNYQELKTLRKKMEQLKSTALKYKRKYGYHEKQQRRALLQESKALKADADALEFYIITDLLQPTEVICSTLVGSSHPVLRGRKFKTAFIDEAAQALEAASWIPILRSHRVVFAGDHQQLPPTIKSVEAARLGLSKTLFEKGVERQQEHVCHAESTVPDA